VPAPSPGGQGSSSSPAPAPGGSGACSALAAGALANPAPGELLVQRPDAGRIPDDTHVRLPLERPD
jgi:hypothetical protein